MQTYSEKLRGNVAIYGGALRKPAVVKLIESADAEIAALRKEIEQLKEAKAAG